MSMGARGAGGGGGGGLAISGTETEDETLTASGGTAPYSWYRYDGARQELLGTGVTRVIPATAVGYQIELVDDVADTALTGTISSSALAWIGADDYSAGIVNRGVGGSNWDLTVTGTVASASDTIGDYVNFTGAGRLQGSGTYNVGAGAAFTLVSLFDIPAAATAAGCLVDFYQSGTERLRLRHASSKLQVFDSAERDYAAPNDGACELGVWRFTGATGERSLYHGAERAAEQGVTYSNQIDSTVELAIGAFRGGGTELTGKFRFCALYAGSLSTAKVAEVRAALKLRWPSVDQAPTDFSTLVEDFDIANATVSGSDITSIDAAIGAVDLADEGVSPATYTVDANMNGQPYARSLPADDVQYGSAVATFDWGADYTAHGLIIITQFVAITNGARLVANYAVGGGLSPEIRETLTTINYLANTPGIAIGTHSIGFNQCIVATSGASAFRLYLGGKLAQETVEASVTHDRLSRFRLLGSGTSGGDYRFCRALLYRRELTPTEALLAACWSSAEYGQAVA